MPSSELTYRESDTDAEECKGTQIVSSTKLDDRPYQEHPEYDILHEVTLNKFNRSTTGRIYDKSFKDIFAMLIVALNLKKPSIDNSATEQALLSAFARIKLFKQSSKRIPYSFSMNAAVEKMAHLYLQVESLKTVTSISYNFKREIATLLIREFYRAKFLHSPADRTRAEPKHNVLLQPTPKGIFIVHAFCVKQGLKRSDMPEILFQPAFNTMQLFTFERDPISDKILFSKNLVYLLFSKLLGPKPNVWSPTNRPDEIPIVTKKTMDGVLESEGLEVLFPDSLSNLESVSKTSVVSLESEFRFLNLQNKCADFTQNSKSSNTATAMVNENTATATATATTSIDDNDDNDNDSNISVGGDRGRGSNSSSTGATELKVAQSPFHHRYYENPRSEAHVQYYVASAGVRMMKEDFVKVGGKIFYNVAGKAICQWLMDCTDIVSPKQALEVASLFVKHNLIVSKEFGTGISSGSVSDSTPSSRFDPLYEFLKNELYTVTENGIVISPWNQLASRSLTAPRQFSKHVIFRSSKSKLTLAEILTDPGIAMQFKKHLEQEFCQENYDAYCQLEIFDKKAASILNTQGRTGLEKDTTTKSSTLHPLEYQKTCMSMAYQIFNTFISGDSPLTVNIDYKLKSKILDLLMKYPDTHDSSSMRYEETEKEREKRKEKEKDKGENEDSCNSSSNENGNDNVYDACRYLNNSCVANSRHNSDASEPEFDQCRSSLAHGADTLSNIREIKNAYTQVRKHLYNLMEIDSVPKFLSKYGSLSSS